LVLLDNRELNMPKLPQKQMVLSLKCLVGLQLAPKSFTRFHESEKKLPRNLSNINTSYL